jgi:alpha-galactosidase
MRGSIPAAIVYSLCQYGQVDVGTWGANAGGNLWRTTGDISDNWASMSNIGFNQQIGREKFAGQGHWNDPDMLEIGNGGMNDTEYRTHMSLWSLLAAPLLAGNDLRSVAPDILEILTNKEVIADRSGRIGKQGVQVSKDGDAEVWARSLADGRCRSRAFQSGATPIPVTAAWSDAEDYRFMESARPVGARRSRRGHRCVLGQCPAARRGAAETD